MMTQRTNTDCDTSTRTSSVGAGGHGKASSSSVSSTATRNEKDYRKPSSDYMNATKQLNCWGTTTTDNYGGDDAGHRGSSCDKSSSKSVLAAVEAYPFEDEQEKLTMTGW